jgi:hypothetical protein
LAPHRSGCGDLYETSVRFSDPVPHRQETSLCYRGHAFLDNSACDKGVTEMNLSRFFTKLNQPIAWLLRSPIHALLDPALMLVTVTGRKSGKRYTIPVGYQRSGDRILVLVSRARTKNWWKNYRQPWPIEVFTRGQASAGIAELVLPDADEFARAFETIFDRMPWLAPQFGIRHARGSRLTAEQLSILGGEARLVGISLMPVEGSHRSASSASA